MSSPQKTMTGAEIVLQALVDQKVEVVFGYPGGAVLPIYDALFSRKDIRHILVRHEQGGAHAAEGYARTTGKPGVLIVTSGPGATNAVTGLADALMDSIPLICISGQVATHLIGNDAFQEADTVGITRSCTKHNWLVKSTEDLARTVHEAFYVATHGRPGPVVIDIPKDVQIASAPYQSPNRIGHRSYKPQVKGDMEKIRDAVLQAAKAEKPIIYSGGGVINSGPEASHLLRDLVRLTGFPITSTLMGLGAYPASGEHWLGMLGMHGAYEANMAMHECDFMLCVGARFDDRVTGRLDAFSPDSYKVHVDIDSSSINKNILVDKAIVGDCAHVLEDMIRIWKTHAHKTNSAALQKWRARIAQWKKRDCFAYKQKGGGAAIKPQHAIKRLYELTKDRDAYITTEVGQHQMWAAQYYRFEEPYRWMTSGGLGTMGYGLPAAIGVQVARPKGLVIDIAGEASVMMTIQELSTAVQHKLPIKLFIINNRWMGMVRQWQELMHGERYSHSYSDALPDFAKLAESFGCKGLRAEKPAELDAKIQEMIETDGPVVLECLVEQTENCYPMIPSGAAHNEILLGPEDEDAISPSEQGKAMV